MFRAGLTVLLSAVILAAHATAAAAAHVRVLRFVDRTRVARFRTGAVRPRTLRTYVRLPSAGRPPYPLVVFGHGFSTTPGLYAPLLDAWARAGFVVAAPVFPVEAAHAPGGPDESDLVNQPGDVRFVISRLLAAGGDPRSPLYRLVDPQRIAVAGQSDGGETAFAVGYERSYADPRVRACVVLSGAWLPGEPLVAGRRLPPLLAVQGTADTVNPPALTDALFRQAPEPKFLLRLLGAGHLPPYSTDRAQLAVVERVTIAFLDAYLGHGSLHRLVRAAAGSSIARLVADP